MAETTNLRAPLPEVAQAQKELTIGTAISRLDAYAGVGEIDGSGSGLVVVLEADGRPGFFKVTGSPGDPTTIQLPDTLGKASVVINALGDSSSLTAKIGAGGAETDPIPPGGATLVFPGGSLPLLAAPGLDAEGVEDLLSTFLVAGDGITLTYDDGAGSLTIEASVPDERIDDRVAALLTAGANVVLTYDDAGNELEIAVPDEKIDDRVAALLVAGANITLTYDDAGGALEIASTGGGGGGGGGGLEYTTKAAMLADTAIAAFDGPKMVTIRQKFNQDFNYMLDNVFNGCGLFWNPQKLDYEVLNAAAIAQTMDWVSASGWSHSPSWTDGSFPAYACPSPLVSQGLGATIWVEHTITAASGTYRVLLSAGRNNNINELALQVGGVPVGNFFPGFRGSPGGTQFFDTGYDITVVNGATQRFTFEVVAAFGYSIMKYVHLVIV